LLEGTTVWQLSGREAFADEVERGSDATGTTVFTPDVVERVVRQSKVIAPDVSGVKVMAIHPSEKELTVACENGALVQYRVSFFQNVPQFTKVRHTGGQVQRSVTALHYVAAPSASEARHVSFRSPYVLLASMLSGQIVVYDAELLTPLFVHQRSGGAIWGMHVVSSSCIYCAMADGAWHQLRLVLRRVTVTGGMTEVVPQLELLRIVPGVSGADRALTVSAAPAIGLAVGTDDVGHVHAWRLPRGTSDGGGDDDDANGKGGDDGSRHRGLSDHEVLWTTRLTKGIALSCVVVGGGPSLEAAHQYRLTRDPHLAHTVLLTYTATGHWDDAVDSFYGSIMCGMRPLDASLELAIEASEAASVEYRKAALMVSTIASALEDLYHLSDAVLEHIVFVQRRARYGRAAARPQQCNRDATLEQHIILVEGSLY